MFFLDIPSPLNNMEKLTPELENKIIESGIPIIDITLEQLMNVEIVESPFIDKIKKK